MSYFPHQVSLEHKATNYTPESTKKVQIKGFLLVLSPLFIYLKKAFG